MTLGTTTSRPYDHRLPTHGTYDAPIVDLFAGPGGWDEGAMMLGITNTYGLEFEANACATAEAAGHARMLGDLSSADPLDYRPCVGLIASPPCQAWSKAGKQQAYLDRAACHDLVRAFARGGSLEDVEHEWNDPRSRLVAEPMRWIFDLMPEWITLEEVPGVRDLWETYAEELEPMGYNVWTGVLNAADYGVPQTRKRAILIASRTRKVGRPVPTHDKDAGMLALGYETPRWITMADALGWGMTERPAFTVTIGGEAGGGADTSCLGGSGARKQFRQERAEGRFIEKDDPASWVLERPATTVVGSFRPDVIAAPGWRKPGDGPRQNAAGSVRVECWEAGVLQSFRPDYPWQGAKTRAYQQVGNAVPPRLAAHVLAEAIGLERSAVLERIDRYYEESRQQIRARRSA